MSQVFENDYFIEYQIHRPRFGNSFGLSEAQQLEQTIENCKKSGKALLMSARGRVFCAGGDVKEYRLNLAIEISNIPNEIKFRKQIRQQILNLLIDF